MRRTVTRNALRMTLLIAGAIGAWALAEHADPGAAEAADSHPPGLVTTVLQDADEVVGQLLTIDPSHTLQVDAPVLPVPPANEPAPPAATPRPVARPVAPLAAPQPVENTVGTVVQVVSQAAPGAGAALEPVLGSILQPVLDSPVVDIVERVLAPVVALSDSGGGARSRLPGCAAPATATPAIEASATAPQDAQGGSGRPEVGRSPDVDPASRKLMPTSAEDRKGASARPPSTDGDDVDPGPRGGNPPPDASRYAGASPAGTCMQAEGIWGPELDAQLCQVPQQAAAGRHPDRPGVRPA